jgi:hypothetical protein
MINVVGKDGTVQHAALLVTNVLLMRQTHNITVVVLQSLFVEMLSMVNVVE